MIKYPIYVTLDTNILDSANYDFVNGKYSVPRKS